MCMISIPYVLWKIMCVVSNSDTKKYTETSISRGSIVCDFRYLSSIHEKYMLAKFSMLIFFTVWCCFSGIFGRFSGIFCLLSSVHFSHSRWIHACKNLGWAFANNRTIWKIGVLQYYQMLGDTFYGDISKE